MTEIKTKGKQDFNIPATKEGRKLIEKLREYKNKGTKLRARPRGPRIDGNAYDCADKDAKWFAVYVGETDKQYEIDWLRKQLAQREKDIALMNNLHDVVNRQQRLYNWLDHLEFEKLSVFFKRFDIETINRNLKP